MPKPCGHPDGAPAVGCRVCELYGTRLDYRRLWGDSADARLPCVHEGAVLESCPTCGGESKHVRDCDLHDKCTRASLGGPIRGCDACADYRTPAEIYLSSASGIGDAVSGLYAACGLASALREPVVYRAHHPAWLAGVSHPWLTVAPHAPSGVDVSDDYDGELWAAHAGTCPSRVQWYCDRAAAAMKVPKFKGVRPSTVEKREPVIGTGYTLLCPFSAHHIRQWPEPNWGGLARRLLGQGKRVVAIAGHGSEGKLKRIFSPGGVECHSGRPVPWVLSAIANAGRVYGNDSGMAHIAGLYSVPAVAVMTHLKADFVFGDTAPTVAGADADKSMWKCQGCAWRGPNYRDVCRQGCGALISLSTDRVLAAG